MKPKNIQWNRFVQVKCFPIEHTWKNWTLRAWRKKNSKIYESQNWFRFLAYSESNDPKKNVSKQNDFWSSYEMSQRQTD